MSALMSFQIVKTIKYDIQNNVTVMNTVKGKCLLLLSITDDIDDSLLPLRIK